MSRRTNKIQVEEEKKEVSPRIIQYAIVSEEAFIIAKELHKA
jgi:hypothetical protein